MSLPREVVPGRDHMITRRCSERRFFLRPDHETNNAFVYCLALAVQRSKVEVNFSMAMPNHHHTGIHDPLGSFPIFTEHFHGLLAELSRRAPEGSEEMFRWLNAWLARAPFDESAHAALIRALVRAGRQHDAELHVDATSRTFEQEGLDWAAMRSAWQAAQQAASAVAQVASDPPLVRTAKVVRHHSGSVVVMPFVAASPNLGNLVDGLTEDLITGLALETAGRSLTADDRDPAAHWAMGRALWLRGDSAEAVHELERSIELSPNFALGHYTLGFVLAQSGDPKAAMDAADTSRALSPFDPLQFAMLACRALAHLRLGEHQVAAAWAVKAATRPNAHVHVLAIAATSLALARRREQATGFVARIHERSPGYDVEVFLRAFRFTPETEQLIRHTARQIGFC